jgi:hypothetical protein
VIERTIIKANTKMLQRKINLQKDNDFLLKVGLLEKADALIIKPRKRYL